MISWAVEVVYQVVMPGDPDENARCCLNGVRLDAAEVECRGAGTEAEAAAGVGGTGAEVDEAEVVGVRCAIGSMVGPFGGGG